MVKLHLFSGFENERLGIKRDDLLGHLYSDSSHDELMEAAKIVGLNPRYLQNSRGFYHFDLWGSPLQRARQNYKVVNNREIYQDMRAMNRGR
jgi:Protein of unknown function (DUF4031)